MAQDEWKPATTLKADAEKADIEQPQATNPFLDIVLYGCVIFLFGFALFLLLPRPLHTYAATPTRYTEINLSVMNDVKRKIMNGALLERAKKNYGMDYSKILTPVEKETTQSMKIIASQCLPSRQHKTWVMLNVSHETFGQATDYLVCAMETEKPRFCYPTERQRLVKQLMIYRTLRQHLIGYEQSYARMFNNPMAQQILAFGRQMMEGDPNFKEPRKANLEIGKDLYGKMAKALTTLNQEGYIKASDFGWSGLVLPEEYAPYLSDEATNIRKCA